jgi:hypothetical protein
MSWRWTRFDLTRLQEILRREMQTMTGQVDAFVAEILPASTKPAGQSALENAGT